MLSEKRRKTESEKKERTESESNQQPFPRLTSYSSDAPAQQLEVGLKTGSEEHPKDRGSDESSTARSADQEGGRQ